MPVYARPLMKGQCGAQGCYLVRINVTALSYPLKTSLHKYGQLFGSLPCALRAGFRVAYTRFIKDLSVSWW